ncbi:MAG: hypothetical protein KKG75_00380 [Nanoarchaeota archaeon]|nr:hypothetical protein [Nanoarchaeota archaeon]
MARHYLNSAFIEDKIVRRALTMLIQKSRGGLCFDDLVSRLRKELKYEIRVEAYTEDQVNMDPNLRERKERLYACENGVIIFPN